MQDLMQSPEYATELEWIKGLTQGRMVIASVDKISPLVGVKSKLISYKAVLDQFPHYRDRLVLIQFCTQGTMWEFVKKTSEENQALADSITKTYPGALIYREGFVSGEKRLALFTLADILLVTTLRDGFCLLPFEYMLVKSLSHNSPGKVIMSEFAGCVTAMSSIHRINPYNTGEVEEALLTALEVCETDTDSKYQHDLKYILSHDTQNWLQVLVEDMKRGRSKNEVAFYLGAIDNRVLKANKFFQPLQFADLQSPYVKSVNRVFLLDSEVPPTLFLR
jgi:trehalose-6-phosphate synthase